MLGQHYIQAAWFPVRLGLYEASCRSLSAQHYQHSVITMLQTMLIGVMMLK